MLCLLKEENRVQCHRYWPGMTDPNKCLELTNHKIYPISKSEVAPMLIERKLLLVNKNGQ